MHKNIQRWGTAQKPVGLLSVFKRLKRWLISALCSVSVALTGCSQIEDAYVKLSSAAVQNQAPITLQLWHGFTGREQEAIETLAEEFNASAGVENRIQLILTGYESLSELADAVFQAAQEENDKTDDLPRLPDLFFAFDDTAYVLDHMGWAVHMEGFLSKEQREMFLDSIQAEACPGENGSMVLFPIGIDTDVLLVNESRWKEFCRETALDGEPQFTDADLTTWEGIGNAAKAYQEWMAAGQEMLPPDDLEDTDAEDEEELAEAFPIPGAGSISFFCTDSWGRLMVAGYESLGKHMFISGPDSIRFSFERSRVRPFWNFWNHGWMNGVFTQESCKDAFASGKAVACLTSTTQARSISNRVVLEENASADWVQVSIRPAPVFSGGNPVTLQETLGLVLTKGSKEKQAAAQIFLQWLMGDKSTDLAVASGRLPAQKRYINSKNLQASFQRLGLSDLEQKILNLAKDQLYSHIQLPLAVFDGGSRVIDTMDELLLSGGINVQQEFLGSFQTESGEQVREAMTDDFAYEEWYLAFRDNVVDLVLIGQKAT